jgi:hypothetical protein
MLDLHFFFSSYSNKKIKQIRKQRIRMIRFHSYLMRITDMKLLKCNHIESI